MHSTAVVLPAPFGPRMPKISPRSTWKEIPSTTAWPPYRLVSPVTSMTGVISCLPWSAC